MKIKKNVMVRFLERVAPIPTINSAILNFTEKGINSVTGCSATATLIASVFLPSDLIEEYIALGEVGVRELQTILKMVKSIESDYILFEKTEQHLIFYNETKTK